jgi:hypothetical protein
MAVRWGFRAARDSPSGGRPAVGALGGLPGLVVEAFDLTRPLGGDGAGLSRQPLAGLYGVRFLAPGRRAKPQQESGGASAAPAASNPSSLRLPPNGKRNDGCTDPGAIKDENGGRPRTQGAPSQPQSPLRPDVVVLRARRKDDRQNSLNASRLRLNRGPLANSMRWMSGDGVADMASPSRGARAARVVLQIRTLETKRAQGMPGAGRNPWPACR